MEEDEIDLADYLAVLIRRKWLIILGTAFAVFATAVYGLVKGPPPPEFEARSSLLLLSPPYEPELKQQSFSPEIHKALAKAEDLAAEVIDSLGLQDREGNRLGINALRSALDVQVVSSGNTKASVLDFVVVSTDTASIPPVRVVNTWSELFVRRNSGISNREVSGSYTVINEQFNTARRNLVEAENTLGEFDRGHNISMLKMELTAKTSRYGRDQTEYVNMVFDLKKHKRDLASTEQGLEALETVDGTWVGSRDVVGTGGIDPAELDGSQRATLQHVIHVRDRVRRLAALRDSLRDARDIDFLAEELAVKRATLTSDLTAMESLEVEAGALDEVLDGNGVRHYLGGNVKVEKPTVTNNEQLRELLSLESGYNMQRPRLDGLKRQAAALRTALDSLEDVQTAATADISKIDSELGPINAVYQTLAGNYKDLKQQASQLTVALNALRLKTDAYGAQLADARRDVEDLSARITGLELERSRLARGAETYRNTYTKFANLLEDARVAKTSQQGDIKIVAYAATALQKPATATGNRLALAFGVGLVLSVFLAFFMEFLERARDRLTDAEHRERPGETGGQESTELREASNGVAT